MTKNTIKQSNYKNLINALKKDDYKGFKNILSTHSINPGDLTTLEKEELFFCFLLRESKYLKMWRSFDKQENLLRHVGLNELMSDDPFLHLTDYRFNARGYLRSYKLDNNEHIALKNRLGKYYEDFMYKYIGHVVAASMVDIKFLKNTINTNIEKEKWHSFYAIVYCNGFEKYKKDYFNYLKDNIDDLLEHKEKEDSDRLLSYAMSIYPLEMLTLCTQEKGAVYFEENLKYFFDKCEDYRKYDFVRFYVENNYKINNLFDLLDGANVKLKTYFEQMIAKKEEHELSVLLKDDVLKESKSYLNKI